MKTPKSLSLDVLMMALSLMKTDKMLLMFSVHGCVPIRIQFDFLALTISLFSVNQCEAISRVDFRSSG